MYLKQVLTVKSLYLSISVWLLLIKQRKEEVINRKTNLSGLKYKIEKK